MSSASFPDSGYGGRRPKSSTTLYQDTKACHLMPTLPGLLDAGALFAISIATSITSFATIGVSLPDPASRYRADEQPPVPALASLRVAHSSWLGQIDKRTYREHYSPVRSSS
jgi:hypothetical protein